MMEYVVFSVLIAMAGYICQKRSGAGAFTHSMRHKRDVLLGIFFGGLIGFYDGVFGPEAEASCFLFLLNTSALTF